MTDRIDQYVEGTLDRDSLDPSERSNADAVARAVSDTRAFIDARPAPDVTAAVMQRVSQISNSAPVPRPGVLATVIGFFWLPRQISIRPAYAIAAAGAVLALFVAVESQTTTLRTTEAAPRLFVQFRLETDAMNVQLAGSFTNWEPAYQLHQMSPGVWTIAVPLPQGVHDYAFIVDGQRWVADPYAPRINDGFGGTNSRLTLLLPDTQRL
jgi:Glycogen recognition site of AMP-activated protein kinase